MPPRRERNGGPAAGLVAAAFQQSAGDAAVFAFELPQVREGGGEAQLLTVAGVDAAHERLDQALVGLAAHAARDEVGDRLVAGLRACRHHGLEGEPDEALRREDPARGQGLEPGRDHAGQALGERTELAAEPHVGAAMARDPRDQLAGEAELFTQPDASRLACEEAVGSPLDQESAHLLGEDGAADARPALDEHDLGVRARSLEAQGGSEAGDPPADDDDAVHVRAESHGAARSSMTSTSVAM